MTTTTRLYKQDQMKLGNSKDKRTQARVDKDRRQLELHMCTLVAARGIVSFGFSKICYYSRIGIVDTVTQTGNN